MFSEMKATTKVSMNIWLIQMNLNESGGTIQECKIVSFHVFVIFHANYHNLWFFLDLKLIPSQTKAEQWF